MHINEPEVTLSIIPASQLAGVEEQKVLIVGQLLAGGTSTDGDLQTDIGNDGSEDTLFGRNSHLAGMIRAFKRENKKSRVDAIGLADDGAAVKGTGIFTITGPATEDGELVFSIGSAKDHKYTVDVLDTDTATDIGDALAALITADLDAPFSAANAIGVVTVTAENGGTLCNSWDLRTSGTVAGIAVALTGWTGGATDPTLTTLLDPIANIRYQTVVWPSSWDIDVIETELNARFNSTNEVKDGVAIQTIKGTLASLKAAVSALNSQSLCIVGNKTVAVTSRIGTAVAEMPDIMSAEIGAIRALRLTQDAQLTQYLTTVATADQFGGIGLASLPYFNTLLPNIAVALAEDFFTAEELDELRDNAVSVVGPNRAFNGSIFGEMVTTYLTDVAGNPDTSYKFLNTVDTASVNREFFFQNYKNRYAQTRLTDGDLIAGRDMVNEPAFRAFTNELYDELAEVALVRSGSVAKKNFNDNLLIAVDTSTGKVTVNMAPELVTQLRVILGTIQINFGD